MNVTKENFADAASEIESLLPSAAFVAIDEEMTGISIPGQQERIEDSPARRYAKMRQVASRYRIIQFGVALFHQEGDGYKARPYNFYIFPETGDIMMEGSAVAFNRDHGMDWNKWIREGIPYVTRLEAEKLKASLLPVEPDKSTVQDVPKTRITLTKAADIEKTGKAIAEFKAWLTDESKQDEIEFEVMSTNAYLRRFLYETFAADFPEISTESRPTAHRGVAVFVALRLSEAQKAERAAAKRAASEAEFARKVGFSRVFKAIVDAKKPVIGHNCMFDWLFAISHFEGPLPESYEEYKKLFAALFPSLFDTKLLATSEPFKFVPGSDKVHRFGSTALSEVYKVFEQEAAAAKKAGTPSVEVVLAPGFERYGPECSAFHEAGYDAYITGYAFAHMAKDAFSAERAPGLSGRTPMFRGLFHFNLDGQDSMVSKGIYVHVRGLKGRDAAELRAAFSDVRGPSGDPIEATDVQIRWIDDDSAFAVLPEPCAGAVTKMLEGEQTGGLTLTSGDRWFAAQGCEPEPEGSEGPPAQKRARTSA